MNDDQHDAHLATLVWLQSNIHGDLEGAKAALLDTDRDAMIDQLTALLLAELGDTNTAATWIDHAFDNRLLARRCEQRDRDDRD